MTSPTLIPVPEGFAGPSTIDEAGYQRLYRASIETPDTFWAEQAGLLDWIEKPSRIRNASFRDDVRIRWFEDGVLNVAANCIDRHLAARGDQTAILWEGDDPSQSRRITYRELHDKVSRFANVLKSRGVGKGDRVTIYMPMIPETAYAMLACARIGAVHSVVFGGFSAESLIGRIQDAKGRVLITADE
ncbi:MAG TPA: AMP-binding protein, partial [Stellaceae bacterium]|nr:AMP-binding protein [Stellaceae bacterium]